MAQREVGGGDVGGGVTPMAGRLWKAHQWAKQASFERWHKESQELERFRQFTLDVFNGPDTGRAGEVNREVLDAVILALETLELGDAGASPLDWYLDLGARQILALRLGGSIWQWENPRRTLDEQNTQAAKAEGGV